MEPKNSVLYVPIDFVGDDEKARKFGGELSASGGLIERISFPFISITFPRLRNSVFPILIINGFLEEISNLKVEKPLSLQKGDWFSSAIFSFDHTPRVT